MEQAFDRTRFAQGVAGTLDPPPPTLLERSTLAWMEHRWRGQWHPARHLQLIEDAVDETIATGGRLIVSVSVRHAKSTYVSRYKPAHYLGRNPDRRVILAGHEADFAATHGRFARDLLTEHGFDDFGATVNRRSTASNRWDIDGRAGGMFTVGVGGSPIGRGADLMIIDDPIKSYQDAMNPLVRQRVKEWWSGTMVSRIEPGGAAIIVMARWHEDDLAGWLLANDPEWRELRLPAIADDPDDPMGRAIGEPLWPERYPLRSLERAHTETALEFGEAVWLAQFQQAPQPPAGGVFPEKKWRFITRAELPVETRWCRGWDLAATEGDGDFTVGLLLGQMPDGRFVIGHVARGQWNSDTVRAKLKNTADLDPHGTLVELPQDPGQAGKDQGQQMVRLLAGHAARAIPQSGSKEVRATGLAAQQQAGNVLILDGGREWEGTSPGELIAEYSKFPKGTHDDQVDAGASAFNRLVGVGQVSESEYGDDRLKGDR